MTNFLREGIPIAKLDGLRPIMERNNFSLTQSSHIVEYIPFILSEEKARLQWLLRDKNIGIIVDGTTRLGEAIATVVRFLDGWTVRQVLVRLHTVAKPVTGQDLAKVIDRCLALEYQIDGERVVAAMRDGASVNGVAIRTLQVLYPNVFDVTCFSHPANNAGHHFQFPVLEKFIRLWVQLFSHSSKAKLAWKQRTSFSIKSYSETRWWSLWEVMHLTFTCFEDVKPFLEELYGVTPHTVRQLLEIMNDEDDCDSLRLQLAAMVDVGRHLVNITYQLEGDGALVFSTYHVFQSATPAFAQEHWPNVRALCEAISDADPDVNARQLDRDTMQGARPAINWFLRKFNVDMGNVVTLFRHARYFDPMAVQDLNLTAENVRSVRIFPFLDSNGTIEAQQAELPSYIAAADGTDITEGDKKVSWWSLRQNNLPAWADAVRKVLLIQPSSAASVRAFSLLACCLSSTQQSALEVYLESSVMIRYNKVDCK